MEQRIDASPRSVFRYLTEPDLWVRWQGDRATLDPVPGGQFEVHMPTGPTAQGTFVVIEPDRRVVDRKSVV